MRPLSGKALIGGVAAIWFLLAGAGLAAADQKDARLPDLFAQLKSAADPMKATGIEAKIWTIWLEANDPVIDQLMTEGSEAMVTAKFASALEMFNAIIARKPDFAEGWNKRATVYFLMGDYEKAIADIDRTLQLEPRHFGALSGLGMSNLKLGRDAAAADAFRRLINIDPLYPNAKRNLKLAQDALNKNSI